MESFQPSLVERTLIKTFKTVNKYVPWHKLPAPIGVFNLLAFRVELRNENLFDGYASTAAQGNQTEDPMTDRRFLEARNSGGSFNSLEMPRMGCSGMRFGRNFPRHLTQKPTEEDLFTPNPRLVSDRFMSRKQGQFKPATSLNLLAACWIQFQVHDWVNHEFVRTLIKFPLL
jgi:hypothetical protein